MKEKLSISEKSADFSNKLRDYVVLCLINQYKIKLSLGQIDNNDDIVKDISYIFNKALTLKLSHKNLHGISVLRAKFTFLEHDETTLDDIIHGATYKLIALCNEDKKAIQETISSLYTFRFILEQSDLYLVSYNTKYLVDPNEAEILCEDVANLTKECIKEFLEELKTTGRIMTSKELAENNRRELELSRTDEEDDYSDDKFEDESDEDTKPSSIDNSRQDVNQRSISFQESKEENSKDRTTSNETETKVDDYNSLLNLVLMKFLFWTKELPEWLQKQILSSSAVKAVIESTEQNAKIYDKKVDLDIYQQDISSEADSFSHIDDAIDQKAYVSEVLSSELVDTNMIFDGNYVSGLILPTSGEQAINFNGLNFNDLAVFM